MVNQRSRCRRALFTCLIALTGLGAIASSAQAAAPGWKLLGVVGPTYLPPKQSEIQRVTVGEAEGGSFSLTQQTAKGQGTLSYGIGIASFTEGSNTATLFAEFNGHIEAGQVIFSEIFEVVPTGTVIESVEVVGGVTTLTLSNPAIESNATLFEAGGTVVTGTSTSAGTFRVGDVVSAPGIQPGTTISAVGSGTLTLSKYATGGGSVTLTASESTAPIAYNASVDQVQSALEALPAFGSGSVTVHGGPGGSGENPYFVDFGGPLADQDVVELSADAGTLTGEHAYAHVVTVVPGGPGTGEIAIAPTNVGGAPTLGPYTVDFGPLPSGIVISSEPEGEKWTCSSAIGEGSFSCTSIFAVAALTPANNVKFSVEVDPGTEFSGNVPVTISGGAAGSDTFQLPITVSSQRAHFGTQAFWAGAFDENGQLETQAGGHPYSADTYFMLNTVRSATGQIVPAADSKDVIVDLPPGFLGNPLVTKRCPQDQLAPSTAVGAENDTCNHEMEIGNFEPILTSLGKSAATFAFPIFNDVPAEGYAAEFTTKLAFPVQSLLASVRSSDDYGVRITAPNNPNFFKIFGSFAALEGMPAAAHGKAFLTNASDCANEALRPPTVVTQADTWAEPGLFSPASVTLPPVTGCDQLEFTPSFSFQPTNTQAASGTGATVRSNIPQDGLTNPDELAQPNLQKAVVTLPEGLILNPSSAQGLAGCSEAQIGYEGPGAMPNPTRFSQAHPTCPDGSKLGTVEVHTPLLDAPFDGTIYLAAQEDNPFHSLIAIYLVVDDPKTGIVLKLPGEVSPDPNTGRLTATFDNNPQLPFEELKLNFRGGGPRSELATPELCGTYKTTGSLTPWSAPESGPPAQIEEAGFTVSSNCASSASARPFAPSFEAGTAGTTAGAYSPLVVKVNRKDGEQELTSLDFTLPKGLIGKLAGIPYCPDAAIAAAAGKSGKAEQASPSCPVASQLGTVDTSAGVGSEPFHVGGHVYLAGPYKGAPVSSVVITPAVAGPFDLGNVVVRAPLYINPESAQLTAKSDPIPTILEGIPLKLRSVTINVDRANFIINPTSCEPMTASASLGGGSGATATPSNRFQVGGCSDLKFSPKLKLALKGGTRRNGNPALTATLTQAAGQAGIGRVSVALPHSEFLDQSHIRTICTRVQFAANECPKAAIYGEAEAISPLLDQPLSGPVYLRSSSHKLPDLVVALKGPASQPIEIDLAGRIDAIHGGIRNTFELLPDAPISKFVLRMQGGKKGLLVNSTNICRGTHKATVKMEGQNGKLASSSPALTGQCKR